MGVKGTVMLHALTQPEVTTIPVVHLCCWQMVSMVLVRMLFIIKQCIDFGRAHVNILGIHNVKSDVDVTQYEVFLCFFKVC